MSTSWKKLEDHVRGVASLKWNCSCKPEHLDGVDFDGVCRISVDELVLIEITENLTLQKIRDDINKIQPTRIRLATQGLICRGFIVLSGEPTPSMIEAGKICHITVCSVLEFERGLFDFSAYCELRQELPFGSAVDSKTGHNDTRVFINVNYVDLDKNKQFTINSIYRSLQRGSKVVLTGDYGTGKSRCVHELFNILKDSIAASAAFPLSINLRDHWSSSSALEIIAGHLGNVGMAATVDNAMRLLNSGHLLLLLDGFDEIGTQVHDTRIENRKALRSRALKGVRDLIQRSKGGLLITGRSHFFDSEEEMIAALGLNINHPIICLGVPDYFSEQEGTQYLSSLGIQAKIPDWLPRKPLVFQTLVELDPNDVQSLLAKEHGQYQFWAAFVYAACNRESNGVGGTIAPQTIQLILQNLAAKTRYSNSFTGRLTPSDIDSAYEMVVGSVPDQSGRQLLSRMCTLGRIEPESPDRQFADPNIVDVLRADSLIVDIVGMKEEAGQKQWIQSLRLQGTLHAVEAIRNFDLAQQCFSYLRKFGTSHNTKRLGEVVSILTVMNQESIDFQGLHISRSTIPILNFCERSISNFTIDYSEIDILLLDGTTINTKNGVVIKDCIIANVGGVSAGSGLPAWFDKVDVINFDHVSNSARIKESPLSSSQKLFMSIVHKIFFQPGSGRQESSLLKGGFGQKYDPRLVETILKMLMNNGLVERVKGNDGWIYMPIRRFTDRMNKIRSELTLSEDALWKEIGRLK